MLSQVASLLGAVPGKPRESRPPRAATGSAPTAQPDRNVRSTACREDAPPYQARKAASEEASGSSGGVVVSGIERRGVQTTCQWSAGWCLPGRAQIAKRQFRQKDLPISLRRLIDLVDVTQRRTTCFHHRPEFVQPLLCAAATYPSIPWSPGLTASLSASRRITTGRRCPKGFQRAATPKDVHPLGHPAAKLGHPPANH